MTCSVLWHGVEVSSRGLESRSVLLVPLKDSERSLVASRVQQLDDLTELIASVVPESGEQIIPLYASKNVKVWSLPPAYNAAATR